MDGGEVLSQLGSPGSLFDQNPFPKLPRSTPSVSSFCPSVFPGIHRLISELGMHRLPESFLAAACLHIQRISQPQEVPLPESTTLAETSFSRVSGSSAFISTNPAQGTTNARFTDLQPEISPFSGSPRALEKGQTSKFPLQEKLLNFFACYFSQKWLKCLLCMGCSMILAEGFCEVQG